MDGDYGLSDLRFAGYSNEELARQVDGLRDGAGSATLHNAVRALVGLADGLAETDRTLREQLKEIGVEWQGQAADGGTEATQNATIYAEYAAEPVNASAKGVDSQGAVFTTTRDSAPDSGTLRGPSQENIGDRLAGFFGHTTDHARQVRATNQARDQAIDGLNGYQSGSSDALGNVSGLPVPPGMDLIAQPVEHPVGSTSTAGSLDGGGPSPVNPGQPGGPTTGPPGTGGPPGSPPPTTTPPPTTGPPGRQFGVGQPAQLPPPALTGNPQLPLRPAINPMLLAETSAMIGTGGATAVGAGAEPDRTVRGGTARPPVKNGMAIGSAPAEDARAARNAERFGAKTGRPAASIMQPAAASGHRADGEDDQEHVRRYGIDSGDVFDDERAVAPESIGDEPDDR